MYPISSTAKGYFDSNKKQVINIRMDTENETYTITENDIISGSFSIDRYSITGNRIEIGTACASECKFRIKNYSNQWDNVKFEGAVLYIRIGIADWENYTSESDIVWIPCGYFTIDKPVKNASILSIEALDRMAKLDKPVDWTNFQVTHTVSYLVSRICDICDVILANGSAIASMPNADYQVTFDMSADITYRNLLQAACMLLGACAFFNENGQLVIKWYSATDVTINESKRYSHTIYENNIQITGVIYVDDTDSNNPVEYISGTKGYCIDISDNPLVGDDIQDVVDALGAVLNGFTYRPYSAVIKPSPYLYPMDIITFVKNNVSYTGIVSNITFGVNSNTSIEGKGETDEDNGYATYGNLTGVQSKIIEYAKGKVDKQISDATTLLMNLNEMVMNSLGLYETSIQQPGGGYQYYFHDASTLANSTIIYTFDANGFAWTDDWNDGDPVWKYGISRDGNAIINVLSAYKISADIITAGTMRAVNLIFGEDPNTTELRTNDAKTGALFEGTGVMQFQTKGEFKAINLENTDTTKTANRIWLYSSSTQNLFELNNHDASGVSSNTLVMSKAKESGSNYVRLGNHKTDGNLANTLYFTRQSNMTSIYLENYSSSSTNIMNFIQLNHYPNNNWNRLLFQNNWINGEVSNWIQCSNAGTASDFQFYNYHNNGNLANTFYMTTTSNSGRLELTNRNSSGNVQSALYFNADGTLKIQTLVNGSSKCLIQASSYGNLDLKTTGALHFDAGSITVQDGNTYRTGAGTGGSPTGTDNVAVKNWDGSTVNLHFKHGIYIGWSKA